MYEKYFNDKKYLFTELTDKYVHQTALLLNSEWPRSLCQRNLSLKSVIKQQLSNELNIPVSLIIIDLSNDQVIGHASLVSITAIIDKNKEENNKITNLAFLQSVIIDKNQRGKGLGKLLMSLSESYLIEYSKQSNRDLKLNCDYIYLNTKDKQGFYESIGYEKIEPIIFYSNKDNKCNQIMKNLLSSISSNLVNKNQFNSDQTISNSSLSISTQTSTLASASAPLSPLPPPPPPPSFASFISKNNEQQIVKANQINMDLTWFKKCLIDKAH